MISRRKAIAWMPRIAVLLALLSMGSSGGCDWFNDPLEANIPPTTKMETACPLDITEGDDVILRWIGDDIDGWVVEYRWSFEGRSTGTTTADSIMLENVGLGEHRFEVSAVDDDGAEAASPAVCLITASEESGPVGRVVLIEFITTQPCANCPNAEEALDVVLEEYGADSLCIVSYHDLQAPVDPVATPETVARIDWYTDTTELEPNTWPIAIFDGEHERAVIGAPSVDWAVSNYEIEIERRRSILSPLVLELTGAIDGSRGEVSLRVEVREPLGQGDYVLRAVVIEDDLDLPPPYHDFGYVARDILDDTPLEGLGAVGDTALVEHDFTLDSGWATENVDVIAFVQNDDTKEVLQAGRLGHEE